MNSSPQKMSQIVFAMICFWLWHQSTVVDFLLFCSSCLHDEKEVTSWPMWHLGY